MTIVGSASATTLLTSCSRLRSASFKVTAFKVQALLPRLRGVSQKSMLNSAACPSKPHPRPLSRGERGDSAEKVELCRVRCAHHHRPGNSPSHETPLSLRERGRG